MKYHTKKHNNFRIGNRVIITNYGDSFANWEGTLAVHFEGAKINEPPYLKEDFGIIDYKADWDFDRETKWRIQLIDKSKHWAYLMDDKGHLLDVGLKSCELYSGSISLSKYLTNNE